MQPRNSIALMVGGLALVVGANSAFGGPVTWEFGGVITFVFDPNDLLGGAVTVGSPLSGSYTFESTTEPTTPGGSLYENAILDVAGKVGGIPFLGGVGNGNSILVLNDVLSAGFDNYSIFVGMDLRGEALGFSLSLRDSTGMIFANNALPLFPPPLDFLDPDHTGFTIGAATEDFRLSGDITFLVPEPGMLVLLSIGALLLLNRQSLR